MSASYKVEAPNLHLVDSSYGNLTRNMRQQVLDGHTQPLSWRLAQLDAVQAFVKDHSREIMDALRADLGKPKMEAYLGEVGFIRKEAAYVKKHLPRWMKPEKVRLELAMQPAKAHRQRQPFGVVLVIGPWNYPFQLLMSPLIGALAAGNTVVVKPSEVSEHTSQLLRTYLPKYLDNNCVTVIEGGVAETTKLLAERFDHICYTGNAVVARVVMAAAAQHLTPVLLELGGKSPCIVAKDADLRTSAFRIAWGKFFNAGQTCVAPDYVLVEKSVEQPFLEELKRAVLSFYGADPQKSPDFSRIINRRHFQRVSRFLSCGDTVVGGQADENDRYIAPTVLRNVAWDSMVMGEEIFGPVLPVFPIDSIDDAMVRIKERDKPLALYLFSRDNNVMQKVEEQTSSGAMVVNHCNIHVGAIQMPFGGVGESGMGAYHGRYSFDAFSHCRTVISKGLWPDPSFVYPPYKESNYKLIQKII